MAQTKSGREKKYRCPYCDFPTYSIYNLNMHIASKHPGKATIAVKDKETVKPKPQLKEFERDPPAPKRAPASDPEDQDEDEDDDEDDIYG